MNNPLLQQYMQSPVQQQSNPLLDATRGIEPPKRTTPFDFVNQYHRETVKSRKARRNKDGSVTTVLSQGVEIDGKIYTLPGYDRDTGKDMTQQEAVKKFMPAIRAGLIPGIPAKWDGPMNQHPANVGASNNHKFLDADPGRPEDIGYDFYGRQ
jgi:hypothetical protein